MNVLSPEAEHFEIFPWNRNFETGVAIVDEQHKQLVRIINKLADHLGHQSDVVDLNNVFDELAAYADYHFKTEEGVWEPYFKDDASYSEHLHTHHSFMEHVVQLKAEEGTKSLDKVVEEVLRYLTHWLAFHILDNDKRMAKTIQAMDAGMSLTGAKQHANQEMSGSMQVLIETVLSMYDNLSSRTLDLMREKTAHKKAQAALQASEAREKTFSDMLMKSVPGLLYLFDHDLNLIRWNHKLAQVTGYSEPELSGMHLRHFFEEKHHDEILEIVWSSFRDGYSEVEGKLVTKAGRLIPYLFTSSLLHLDGKNCFVGIGVDISRYRLEKPDTTTA